MDHLFLETYWAVVEDPVVDGVAVEAPVAVDLVASAEEVLEEVDRVGVGKIRGFRGSKGSRGSKGGSGSGCSKSSKCLSCLSCSSCSIDTS